MPSHRLSLSIIAAFVLATVGCKEEYKLTSTRPAPSGTLTPPPLKAWVILHPSDTGVGAIDNWGSRLTDQEIKEYMASIVKNANIFGANAKFTWNAQAPYTAIRPDIGSTKPQDRRVSGQSTVILMNALTSQPATYDPNAINIYFGGYIQFPTDGHPDQTIAFTIDPSNAGQGFYVFLKPFIVFNDQDWDRGVHLPAQTNNLFIEHEVGHYLIRESELNGYYLQKYGKVIYDSEEHFMAWPSNVDTDAEKRAYKHLMKKGFYSPLYPNLDDLTKENAYNRLFDYKWQDP